MILTKCKGCSKRYDDLYGECPWHEITKTSFKHLHKAFSFCTDKHPDESYLAFPKEWLDYEFECNFYSPKPKTVEDYT